MELPFTQVEDQELSLESVKVEESLRHHRLLEFGRQRWNEGVHCHTRGIFVELED